MPKSSNLHVNFASSWLLAVLFPTAVVFWSGCAATRSATPVKPAIVASPKDALYVAVPAVPGSVDSALARMGWGSGRFAQELRQELVFQLNRKGIPTLPDTVTPADTSAARSSLAVRLSAYTEGGGAPSSFKGEAMLKTSLGERRFDFGKTPQRAEAPERADPTVDNIRQIAESIVAEACKAPETKKRPEPEPMPPLMLIF